MQVASLSNTFPHREKTGSLHDVADVITGCTVKAVTLLL